MTLRALGIGLAGGLIVAFGVTWLTMDHTPPPPRYWVGDRSQFAPVEPTTARGSGIALTDTLRPHDRSVWIDKDDAGLVIDHTPLDCHGGRLRVTWTVGNLEPAAVEGKQGLHLSARFDGEVLATIYRAGYNGIHEDAPASLHAVVDCPAGAHVLDLEIGHVTGVYGLPYVTNLDDPPRTDVQVLRGFIVMEVY